MLRKTYPLHQCALYKVTSPKQLAKRLKLALDELELLAGDDGNFNVYPIEQNGKKRIVEEPKRKLQLLHKRVNLLLARCEVPNYLHSAIKGRSYLTNARAHDGAAGVVKVDVRSFFRSVQRVSVYSFFRDVMHCADDVSALLARLLTYEGHLPTGSSASPIISYYAHKAMFDQIDALAKSRDLCMTCYVDDMSISGIFASPKLLYEVRKIIARHGLKSHKAHYFAPRRPKVVTGVVITAEGPKLPNRRHKKINEEYQQFLNASDDEGKIKVLNSLTSRVYEAAMVDGRWLQRAKALSAERKIIAARIRTGIVKGELP